MSVSLADLWLPILLSGIAIFILSSLIWTVVQYHNADWRPLPDEEAARAALKGLPVGQYSLPHAADNAARSDEAWQARYREGPVAMLTVMPHGELSMGRQMVRWFAYCLVISMFVAYVAGSTLAAGTSYLKVFQVTSTTTLLAYGGASGINLIWFGHTAARTARDLLDALVYGLVTAGIFGWLWP